MKKSTTIVNHFKTDRVVRIIISENEYVMFTLHHTKLIIIDMTDRSRPILLCNKTFTNRESLEENFDKMIILSTKMKDADDFVYHMDTYIDLFTNSIKNESSEEIFATFYIILEEL